MKARYKGANPPSAVRSMAELTLNTGLLILIFWVVVPTVDQYSDLGLVFRLYTGPEEDLMVSGGRCHESFCNMQYCSLRNLHERVHEHGRLTFQLTKPTKKTLTFVYISPDTYFHHLWQDDGGRNIQNPPLSYL